MANFEHAEDDPKHVNMSGETPEASASAPPAGGASAPGADAAEAPCVIPSFAAASELLSAPYSCLVRSTHRRHVALPPMYLHKKRTGIREELEGELLKFSPSLTGVPLAYENIRIVGQHGNIYDDSGYIHMDIEANFIVFQPQKGQKLLGKVNKLSAGHVGCLVHGCFNASIPKPNLVAVETWRDAGPRIGAELEFDVTALDADTAGVLLIRGRLDRTRVQELLAMAESAESSVPTEQPEEENPAPAPTEECPDDTPKKKKKKKKDKLKEEDAGEAVTAAEQNGAADEADGNVVPEKTKKKKKKKDKLKEEDTEEAVTAAEQHGAADKANGNVVPEKTKKKKKKKDKLKEEDAEEAVTAAEHNEAADEANGNVAPEKTKKKKKEKRLKRDAEELKEETEEVELSAMEIQHSSDSSGYHSDKPSKKRKREAEAAEAAAAAAAMSEVPDTPKSKKKRKSDIT